MIDRAARGRREGERGPSDDGRSPFAAAARDGARARDRDRTRRAPGPAGTDGLRDRSLDRSSRPVRALGGRSAKLALALARRHGAADASGVRCRMAVPARSARPWRRRQVAPGPGRRLRARRRRLGGGVDPALPTRGDAVPALPALRPGGLGRRRDGRTRARASGFPRLSDCDLPADDRRTTRRGIALERRHGPPAADLLARLDRAGFGVSLAARPLGGTALRQTGADRWFVEGEGRGRGGEPCEVGLPREREPRAAHAARAHPRTDPQVARRERRQGRRSPRSRDDRAQRAGAPEARARPARGREARDGPDGARSIARRPRRRRAPHGLAVRDRGEGTRRPAVGRDAGRVVADGRFQQARARPAEPALERDEVRARRGARARGVARPSRRGRPLRRGQWPGRARRLARGDLRALPQGRRQRDAPLRRYRSRARNRPRAGRAPRRAHRGRRQRGGRRPVRGEAAERARGSGPDGGGGASARPGAAAARLRDRPSRSCAGAASRSSPRARGATSAGCS